MTCFDVASFTTELLCKNLRKEKERERGRERERKREREREKWREREERKREIEREREGERERERQRERGREERGREERGRERERDGRERKRGRGPAAGGPALLSSLTHSRGLPHSLPLLPSYLVQGGRAPGPRRRGYRGRAGHGWESEEMKWATNGPWAAPWPR